MFLVAERLSKTFRPRGILARGEGVKALDEVSFTLEKGESLGVVGESGSGKSTLLRVILRLLDHDSGALTFDGTPLERLTPAARRAFRRRVQPVFQDPYSTFNPRFSVASSIALALEVNGIGAPATRRDRVRELLSDVGLDPDLGDRLPHQLSGGQRQRAAIARALAVGPELLVLDEPTSALDVSVQAQVLNLFKSLKAERGFSMVFVTHDLALVSFICERTLVMRKGRVVEQGPTRELIAAPSTDYARNLIAAVPSVPEPRTQETRP